MENNTVVISLDKYNELREFKEKIEEGKTFYTADTGWGSSFKKFIGGDECVKIITKQNKELIKEYNEFKIRFRENEEKFNQRPFSRICNFIYEYQILFFVFGSNIFTGTIIYLLR